MKEDLKKIRLIAHDRRTEILIHKSLEGDFDKIIKDAMKSLFIRADFKYHDDTDNYSEYRLNYRLVIKDRINLEKRLFEYFKIEYSKNENKKLKRETKDYRKYNTTSFMGVSKTKTEFICGFIGNLIQDEGKAPFEFLYI